MRCPNCNEEMRSIDRLYVGFGDEPDYDMYYHVGDECRRCHILYDAHYDFWELPKALRPTEKQVRTAHFILNRLDVPADNLVTKKQYCDFIGKYFKEELGNEATEFLCR